MPIDLWSYPHILDLILDSASDAALVALRSTHHSMRDYIDHRMFRRLGYVHWDESLFEGEEFTEPSSKISNVAPKVRTLDIYSKGSLRWDPETDLSDSDEGFFYLPDDPEYYDFGVLKDVDISPLTYVRYLGVDMKDVFPVTSL